MLFDTIFSLLTPVISHKRGWLLGWWLVLVTLPLCADNFTLHKGDYARFYCSTPAGSSSERAAKLFEQDYADVFSGQIVHTSRMDDARLIACTVDNPDLRRYASVRGITFDSLVGRSQSFILKVHNGGRQLFVVGSDDLGLAFGLMTVSRQWGVSPFSWWMGVPPVKQDYFELDVAYERIDGPGVTDRVLVIEGAQAYDRYVQDLLLRLRATALFTDVETVPDSNTSGETFRWTLQPAGAPFLGLSLPLEHPNRLRIEGLRAWDLGLRHQWRINWKPQLGGEFHLLLLFDMAWNAEAFRDAYALDQLLDTHYTQLTGLSASWSQLWNDFYDFITILHPDQLHSSETFRRLIGESQSLSLQLSMELNDRHLAKAYTNAFFRSLEYPINMTMAQVQRISNIQMVLLGSGKQWNVEDCKQRMELLASELPVQVSPKWRQMLGSVLLPVISIEKSLLNEQGKPLFAQAQTSDQVNARGLQDAITQQQQALEDSLSALDETTALIYRSTRATGTPVLPLETLDIPLNYEAASLHLVFSFLPVRSYGQTIRCLISVDNGEPRLVQLDTNNLTSTQQLFDLSFIVDPSLATHHVKLKTLHEGVFLQRIWLYDMQ